MRPCEGLDVRQHLTEVIPVVVNPFVEQVSHAQEADLRMAPAAPEVGGAETGDEGDALETKPGELVDERRGVALAVRSR